MKPFKYLGFFVNEIQTNPYNLDVEYDSSDLPKLTHHRDYLKEIEKSEHDRLDKIENKTSQIVAQTGVIFSLLSLFVPLFFDTLSNQPLPFRILFFSLLTLSFLFYVCTIHHSIKIYNIKNYKYGKASPTTVLNLKGETIENFVRTEVKDLLYIINRNTKTNNIVGDNLIYAYRSFQIANICTALLGGLLCFSLLFVEPEQSTTQIKGTVKIENLDTELQKMLEKLTQINSKVVIPTKDTLEIKAAVLAPSQSQP
jgi:hypothetical protein